MVNNYMTRTQAGKSVNVKQPNFLMQFFDFNTENSIAIQVLEML